MTSVPCNLVQAQADLQNPGDFLILEPQAALCPAQQQLRVVLPDGAGLKLIDIQRGVSGDLGWNGDPLNPILNGAIVTRAWRGWMQWVGGVSWLVANP